MVDGTAEEVRTATWTVYDDPDHATYSFQGYETLNGETVTGNYLVNPASITIDDADGNVTDQIQADLVLNGANLQWGVPGSPTDNSDLSLGSSPLTSLGDLGPAQATSFVAWTADNCTDHRLTATAVYFSFSDLSGSSLRSGSSFLGTLGVNYTQTLVRL